MIVIQMDKRDLEDLLGRLQALPKGLEQATSRAINKTLVSTRAEMVRAVREDYAVKAGAVRKELKIHRAAPNRLDGRIAGEGSPGIPLREFARTRKVPSTERTSAFVRVKAGYLTRGFRPADGIPVVIRKDKGKVTARGVFLAKMRSGHVGAFKRIPGARMRKQNKEAIGERFGPSPLKILESDRYAERIEDFAGETMDKNLQHEADFILKKDGLL